MLLSGGFEQVSEGSVLQPQQSHKILDNFDQFAGLFIKIKPKLNGRIFACLEKRVINLYIKRNVRGNIFLKPWFYWEIFHILPN